MENSMSFWQRLKTSSSKLKSFFTHRKKIDIETLDDLEDLLITSDFGYKTVEELRGYLQKHRSSESLDFEDVCQVLKEQLIERLQPFEKKIALNHKTQVIVMVGVNGSGKTTTLSKLTYHFKGKLIEWAACDTFRAGAKDQLEIWANRLGVSLYKDEKEPAALAYQAFENAKKHNTDILFIDTAGRLQNNVTFMAELQKIVRVLNKIDPDAPHDIILVLDGTVGQNALNQVKLFKEYVPLTGCIMTKLDGTAKGGILVRLVDEFQIPILGLCYGESMEDFEEFNAEKFIDSIF